jgi:hypothetical protein
MQNNKSILPALMLAVVILLLIAGYFYRVEEEDTIEPASENPLHDTENLIKRPTSAPDSPALPLTAQPDKQALQPELHGKSGKAGYIYRDDDEALEAILEAADSGNPSIKDEFTLPDESCTWCDDLYDKLLEIILNDEALSNRRVLAADILSLSGSVHAANLLLNSLKHASKQEDKTMLMEAVARMNGTEEIIELASQALSITKKMEERQSLVAFLSYQHSLPAARALFEDIVKNSDHDGFASLGIGLMGFNADETARSYLYEKAKEAGPFAEFPLASLIQSGTDGVDRALSVLMHLNKVNGSLAADLAKRAKHILHWRNQESIAYLKERAALEQNKSLHEIVSFLIS